MQKHLHTRRSSQNADRLQRGVSFVSGVRLRLGLVSMTFEVGSAKYEGWKLPNVGKQKKTTEIGQNPKNFLRNTPKVSESLENPKWIRPFCSILGRTPYLSFTSIGFPDKAVLLLQLAILAKKSRGRWTFTGKTKYVGRWLVETSHHACGCISPSSNFRGDL